MPARPADPLYRAANEKWQVYKSQNQLEGGLVMLLRTTIPQAVRLTVVAGRGFGRADFARWLQEQGFGCELRVKTGTSATDPHYTGRLSASPLRPGTTFWLPEVG